MNKKMSLMSIVGILVGALIGAGLVYYFQGQFPIEVLAGAAIAAILLIIYQIIKQSRKKNNIPEVDERVSHNMFRFLSICSHLAVLLLTLCITGYTAIGRDAIPLLPLWIIIFVYIWVSGIGLFVIKRR